MNATFQLKSIVLYLLCESRVETKKQTNKCQLAVTMN